MEAIWKFGDVGSRSYRMIYEELSGWFSWELKKTRMTIGMQTVKARRKRFQMVVGP
jgi:hypothetical protein